MQPLPKPHNLRSLDFRYLIKLMIQEIIINSYFKATITERNKLNT